MPCQGHRKGRGNLAIRESRHTPGVRGGRSHAAPCYTLQWQDLQDLTIPMCLTATATGPLRTPRSRDCVRSHSSLSYRSGLGKDCMHVTHSICCILHQQHIVLMHRSGVFCITAAVVALLLHAYTFILCLACFWCAQWCYLLKHPHCNVTMILLLPFMQELLSHWSCLLCLTSRTVLLVLRCRHHHMYRSCCLVSLTVGTSSQNRRS